MLAQIWEHGDSLSCMKLDKSQGKELIIYKMMNNDEIAIACKAFQ